jgi:hypothetical protein
MELFCDIFQDPVLFVFRWEMIPHEKAKFGSKKAYPVGLE